MAAAVDVDRAREAALALLDRRAYPRRVLLARLRARGHDEVAARRALDALADAGVLDDRHLAKTLARGVLARGPASAEHLADRLVRRGIGEDVAREVAAATLAGMDLVETAADFAQRQLAAARGADLAAARRIAGRLRRRGLHEETILSALRRIPTLGPALEEMAS